MTVLERKAKLVKAILNDADEDMLNELEAVFYCGSSRKEIAPCQHTIEELNEQARRAIEDVEAGRVVPHEEVKRQFRS